MPVASKYLSQTIFSLHFSLHQTNSYTFAFDSKAAAIALKRNFQYTYINKYISVVVFEHHICMCVCILVHIFTSTHALKCYYT